MLNHPQMFPSEWKMIFYGSHCWTETTPPTCHTQRPHPLATPTGHTHQPHPSTDLPATPSSHFHYSYDSCVWWMGVSGRCQVGVSGGRVRWVWHTYLTHPPATPTCYSSSHFHVSSDSCVWWMVVSGGRIR